MGFQVIDQGIRIPKNIQTWKTPQRVKRLQQIMKDRKVQQHEEKQQDQTQKEKEKRSIKQLYEKSEYSHQSTSIHANQIMSSPVITINHDADLSEAWKIIKEQRYRHLPVISSQDKKLIGIISDRDLLYEAAHIEILTSSNRTNDPHIQKITESLQKLRENKPSTHTSEEPQKKAVMDICKTQVLTATPDAEMREIAKVLIEKHIGSMPVIDEEGFLLGIITRSDILRTIISHPSVNFLV